MGMHSCLRKIISNFSLSALSINVKNYVSELTGTILCKHFVLFCVKSFADRDATRNGRLSPEHQAMRISLCPSFNRKHSFQLFVVVLYTCSVLYQLVSPSLAHATP